MRPPPTLIHQRISANLFRLLNARLDEVRPQWRADFEIGVLLPGDERYNPEPDVTVIDADVAIGQIYAERFYFVAEVLPKSDDPAALDAKLAYYRAHAHNQGVLFVRQDRVEAELHIRPSLSEWTRMSLKQPGDRIDAPGISVIGRLAELYRFTPLFPSD